MALVVLNGSLNGLEELLSNLWSRCNPFTYLCERPLLVGNNFVYRIHYTRSDGALIIIMYCMHGNVY